MPEESTKSLGIIILVALSVIIGASLLTAIADPISRFDRTFTARNESITASNVTAASLANNWVTSVDRVVANNDTEQPLTEGTNYTVTGLNLESVPTIKLTKTAAVYYNGNATLVNYTYQDDNYIRGSTGGTSTTLVKLIIVLFAIGILAVAITGLYRMGLFDMIKGN